MGRSGIPGNWYIHAPDGKYRPEPENLDSTDTRLDGHRSALHDGLPSGKYSSRFRHGNLRSRRTDRHLHRHAGKWKFDDVAGHPAHLLRASGCFGIDWKKKDTYNKHLSVLDYKKQERAKEVAALGEELEGAQVVLELKEERIESLEKEIESKRDGFRKEQSEAQKKLDDTIAEKQKLRSETTDLRLKNSELRAEYYENVDKLSDKQKEMEAVQKEADKWMIISDTAKWQTEQAQFELEEAERLKKELLRAVDGDDYLKVG